MEEYNATVGIYKTHQDAVNALRILQEYDFPVEKLSIIGKGKVVEDVTGTYNWEDATNTGIEVGGVVGGVIGILAGVSLITLPGIGLVYAGGALAAALMGGTAGAMIGSGGGGLAGALLGIGLGKEGVLKYKEHLEIGRYLVIVRGTNEEAHEAKHILLEHTAHEEVAAHV